MSDLKQVELKDTVEMMNSADYKERFKAEYHQLNIRYKKLKFFVEKYRNNELDFKPSCTLDLLESQVSSMETYLSILETRSMVEGVNI